MSDSEFIEISKLANIFRSNEDSSEESDSDSSIASGESHHIDTNATLVDDRSPEILTPEIKTPEIITPEIVIPEVNVSTYSSDPSSNDDFETVPPSSPEHVPYRPYSFKDRRTREEVFTLDDKSFGNIHAGMTKAQFSKFEEEFGHYLETGSTFLEISIGKAQLLGYIILNCWYMSEWAGPGTSNNDTFPKI